MLQIAAQILSTRPTKAPYGFYNEIKAAASGFKLTSSTRLLDIDRVNVLICASTLMFKVCQALHGEATAVGWVRMIKDVRCLARAAEDNQFNSHLIVTYIIITLLHTISL